MVEIEVFRITTEVEKCYEHIEATRRQYLGGGNHRYFSTNTPRYVGKFVQNLRYGSGDGATTTGVFRDGPKENRVEYSYEGFTCFVEVPCRIDKAVNSRAKNQQVRNVYEKKTGMNASPGAGPANIIRSFVGVKVPKGAEGGKRARKTRKSRKTRKTTRRH